MKYWKKVFGILLAFAVVVSMSASALAADTTISAPSDSTRSYDVYQIFTGDLAVKDGKEILSNVKWGKNGTGTEGNAVDKETLNALEEINGKSDTEKLSEIEKYVDFDSEKLGTVKGGMPLTVPTGYYLLKDNGPVEDGESYSLYIVQVAGPTVIDPKNRTTTSEKKVDDKNDSDTSQDETVWEDSADYDIGDDVPFQLKATIADDYDNYTVYKLTFHDKEEKGLKFNADSVKVYVDGKTITSGYEVITSGLNDGDTFDVHFADLKQIASVKAGSVITVEYTSLLTEDAVIGSAGNKNKMHITYSNNPNDKQGGENGKTPDDTVIVFTYKTVVNKVDQNKKPLKGAGFTLYKKDASGVYHAVGSEIKGADQTTFEWKGLDDGDYKIVETTTPSGYNTCADIEFTIMATHDVKSDSPALKTLSGGNLFTGEIQSGAVTTDIVNQAGKTLPETGDMGTTIFYVLGSLLSAGALVLLIVKKRMKS